MTLSMNLLSIKKIVDHENSVVFYSAGCGTLNSAKEVNATGSQVNGLYRSDGIGTKTAYAANATLADIWDRRFAHLGSENMKLLAKGYVKGVNLSDDSVSSCTSLAEGRQHRRNFPSEGSRASKILEIIHSDVCGHMEVKSVRGSLYFVTFIDDDTRKVKV